MLTSGKFTQLIVTSLSFRPFEEFYFCLRSSLLAGRQYGSGSELEISRERKTYAIQTQTQFCDKICNLNQRWIKSPWPTHIHFKWRCHVRERGENESKAPLITTFPYCTSLITVCHFLPPSVKVADCRHKNDKLIEEISFNGKFIARSQFILRLCWLFKLCFVIVLFTRFIGIIYHHWSYVQGACHTTPDHLLIYSHHVNQEVMSCFIVFHGMKWKCKSSWLNSLENW